MADRTSLTFISELRFGSFLVYSPHGQSSVAHDSRTICYAMKQDLRRAIGKLVDRLTRDFASTPLHEVLGPDATLVPVPRSAPLVEGALWPSRRIADELVKHGLGAEVLAVLLRVAPVPRSSHAAPGERPTVAQHIESFGLDSLLANPQRITIVDDVVTKGRTLLATASLLRARYPDADLRAFALVRTIGLLPDIEKIVAPTAGVIREHAGDAYRFDNVPESPR